MASRAAEPERVRSIAGRSPGGGTILARTATAEGGVVPDSADAGPHGSRGGSG